MYTKKALIRAEDGKSFYVHCECGARTPIAVDQNRCTCGIVYDSGGWIRERPNTTEAESASEMLPQPHGN